MNEVTTFTAPAGMNVRVVTIDGNPWFVAADVCRALGMDPTQGTYQWLRGLADDEQQLVARGDHPEIFSGSRASTATIISESGLYKLVLRSGKPEAQQFQDWVTREVLPSIRKNGGYIAGQEQMSDLELLAKALQVSQRISAEKSERIAVLEEEIKVLHFGGEMRTVREFCKATGIVLNHGQRLRLGLECAAYTRVSGQEPEHRAVSVRTPYGSTGSQVRVYPTETINHCAMVLGLQ
jgi:prophage antirepressor-like protein